MRIGYRLGFFIFSIAVSTACLPIKPGAQKSGKTLYETFYAGEEGTQYFIKPFNFKEKEGKGTLTLDQTFRYKNTVKDSALINFSVFSEQIIKTISSIKFTNEIDSTTVYGSKLMFNEKQKKGFHSRFVTKVELADLRKLYNGSNWRITIEFANQQTIYNSTKKTNKKIKKLNDNLFVIF